MHNKNRGRHPALDEFKGFVVYDELSEEDKRRFDETGELLEVRPAINPQSTLGAALWAIVVLSLTLIVGGIVLAIVGAAGNTELVLFGNTIESTSAGVIGIVVGAVIGLLGVRRILTALERLMGLGKG